MAVEISAGKVKELREKTGVSLMDCKKALVESAGDIEKATDWLRKKGMETAAKKSGRDTKEGRVNSYIHHNGKVGVLVEVNCETDFVAKSEDFDNFMKDLTFQIAAASPQYVSRDEVPEDVINREKEIYKEQVKDKPANAIEKIVEGKLNKFFSGICLLDQEFLKEPGTKMSDYIKNIVAKLGENIQVRRFARFEIGAE